MSKLEHPSSRGRRREFERYYKTTRDGFGNIINVKDKYAPKVLNTPYCTACGKEKMMFKTEEEAMRFIEYNSPRIAEQKGIAPIRAYYCKKCCCWHITSQPKRNHYHTAV